MNIGIISYVPTDISGHRRGDVRPVPRPRSTSTTTSISGGGDEPDAILAALHTIVFPDGGVLPDIVWDGAVDQAKLVDGAQRPEDRLCVQETDAEVLNADAANGFAAPTIGVDEFDCTLEPLDPVELAGA